MQLRVCLFLIFSICFTCSEAKVRLPRMVSNGMVLQRDEPVRIWGWADSGETFKVRFLGQNYKVKANADGNWTCWLKPAKAGGPYEMVLEGKETVTIRDIMMGDVWLFSGQSNMVLPMERVQDLYAQDIATANFPGIRQFLVPVNPRLSHPMNDVGGGEWIAASPVTVKQFSAVAFFFSRALHQRYKVPVGIINASVGGTPVEAWTSEGGLKAFPTTWTLVQHNKDTGNINPIVRRLGADTYINDADDPGLKEKLFQKPQYFEGAKTLHVPGYWEDQGLQKLNGIVWLHRTIDLPRGFSENAARLWLGRIVDADEVWVNGIKVGGTTYQYPPRRYHIDAGVLKEGKNNITLRVINYSGKGGFVTDKLYGIVAGGDTISLSGEWKYHVSRVFRNDEKTRASFPFQNQPAALFNGMIAPFLNATFKGVCWYQGESNVSNAGNYRNFFTAMINDWRKGFGKDSLPFLFAQLASFGDLNVMPVESDWAKLQEAQLQTLSVPGTAMAVTLDLGEWNDIHPLRKKEVGERLFLAARHLAYGEKGFLHSGPVARSVERKSNKAVIYFHHTGSGLQLNSTPGIPPFDISGQDGIFYRAEFQLFQDRVEVWHLKVAEPSAVRYAWADYPAGPMLLNSEGLPASPFQLKIER